MKLSDISIHAWIGENQIRNEKGDPIDFSSHLFLFDIYRDQSDLMTCMKAAQVGMSTTAILKNHYDASRRKMDIIYTLPTDNDVRVFVGGKVNRIIANNKCMLEDVADKDSIEQKQVGNSMIYFRGTWTKKAAIMVTADRLVHDEKDSSKLDVIADYQARLQHSKFKQTHTFSHPSLPEIGVHADWLKSDQKHWFVKCSHCNRWQFLNWDMEDEAKMSVDMDRGVFVCKKCHKEIDDNIRACGEWVQKYQGRKWSGYWIPMLIAPWVKASELVAKWRAKDMTPEFFAQKILGLPYSDGAAKLLRQDFLKNLTGTPWAPGEDERVVIGIDTGLKLDAVAGNQKGLFWHGAMSEWREADGLMKRWPKGIAIVDAGGDLIGSRAFQERWNGRVFLCYLSGDRKTKELFKWGKGDEHGVVIADRNRSIQLVVDEFRDGRVPVHGDENDWYEYWLDWNNLSKIKVLDPETNQVRGFKWVRSGRDHRALATVFWRVGMSRFAGMGEIIAPRPEVQPNSYMVEPNQTAKFNPDEVFKLGVQKSLDAAEQAAEEWRIQ